LFSSFRRPPPPPASVPFPGQFLLAHPPAFFFGPALSFHVFPLSLLKAYSTPIGFPPLAIPARIISGFRLFYASALLFPAIRRAQNPAVRFLSPPQPCEAFPDSPFARSVASFNCFRRRVTPKFSANLFPLSRVDPPFAGPP